MLIVKRIFPILLAVAMLPVFFPERAAVGGEAALQIQPEACATVTFVEGAPLLVEPASAPQPVIAGRLLFAGSTVQTDSASRLELTFAGGGILRLAEETTIELEAGGRLFQAMLLKGDMWANFSNQDDTVQILAAVGMFSGPESVFRVAMFGNGAVEVKTYTGQVTASGPFEIKKENGLYKPGALKGAGDAAPEPWQHQIAPYRKMIALATGEATEPFRFAAKSDLTEWVRWNQQRDEEERPKDEGRPLR